MLIHDKPEQKRRKMLLKCMDNYDVGDRESDWPHNMISTHAVVLISGAIVRRGTTIARKIDSAELGLCRRLAKSACTQIPHLHFDIGSEESNPVWEFYVAAEIGKKAPKRITATFIRSRFGGTLFPPTTITVEPLKEKGVWWSEVVNCSGETGEELEKYLRPYRNIIEWFTNRQEFVSTAFVRIGDVKKLAYLSESEYPEGTKLEPCVLPRLALGLTVKGSLAGIFGYTVQT